MLNQLLGFLGATTHVRLIGVALALLAVAMASMTERGTRGALVVRLSAATPWVVGTVALLLLLVAEYRYAGHRAPLDLIEAQYAIVSWTKQFGQGLYELDPARRVVGVAYGPLSYVVYEWVQRVFGPSMVTLKLAAAACTAAGVLLAAISAVRMAGLVAGGVAVSLVVAALASGGVFFLLVRSDPLLMMLVGAAALLMSSSRRPTGHAALSAFAVTGVMALIKPHLAVALWSVLLLVDERTSASRRQAVPAILRAGAAAAIGMCVAVAVRPGESYELVRLLLGMARSIPIRADLLAENLLLAGIPLVLCAILEVGTGRLTGQPAWPVLVAVLGCLTAIVPGSIDGATDNHALLVLVMCILWGASLWRRMVPRHQRTMRLAAMGLSLSLVPALLGKMPSLLWQTRGDESGISRWIAEGQAMIRAFGGRVTIGIGDNRKPTYEALQAAPYLVYAGAEHRLDPMAVMTARKMGTSAAAFRPLLASRDLDAWILPTDATPFALENWFGGEGPLFGPLERRAFESAFHRWCRGAYWTLWVRTSASRSPMQCAGTVLASPQ